MTSRPFSCTMLRQPSRQCVGPHSFIEQERPLATRQLYLDIVDLEHLRSVLAAAQISVEYEQTPESAPLRLMLYERLIR